MSYQLVNVLGTSQTDQSVVVRMADNAWIPADPANADWQYYQAWLAAGNTPTPAPAAPLASASASTSASASVNPAGTTTGQQS